MRIYRALLHLYPASFRHEYGEEMCAIAARRRQAAAGALGVAALWLAAWLEIVPGAAAVHWDLLRQDLGYLLRSLARSPGFALTAIAVVALGIGANTAAFSVTDFVLVRPLPFAQPERLVKLWERLPGYDNVEVSPANYRDWKQLSRSFSAMGATHPFAVNMVGQGAPARVKGTAVTSEVLPLLGVRPALGRLFTAVDDRDGAAGTLLLGDGLWRSAFGADPGVLGRRLLLDGEPFVVIGVMPRGFRFPDRETQIWTPARFDQQAFQDRTDYCCQAVARLRPGVSLARARAEMAVVAARLERQYPKENAHTGVNVLRLRDETSRQTRLLLLALCGAALCVLLIACANLANLLVARALARRQELAVRAALGAGRERLVRQLLTESLALATAGGALGVAVAVAAVPLLTRLVPDNLPLSRVPGVDLRVLVFAALLTTLTGLGFGLIPALRACGAVEHGGPRQGARGGGGGRSERLRAGLVVFEVAASLVLLISAGLLMRALWRLQATDPGFRPSGVLTLRTALPFPQYDPVARRQQLYGRVLSAVRSLPGVESAAYIGGLPMARRGGIWPVEVEGEPRGSAIGGSVSERNAASLRFVTPGFFASLGIPVREGRDVAESDTRERPLVAVVSESCARRHWPRGDVLGRRFHFAFHDRTVVGVVGDVRVRGFERASEPQVYLPAQQMDDGWLRYFVPEDLVIRASAGAASLLPAVRRIVRAADPQLPVSDVRTMDEVVAGETAPRGVALRILGAFAAIAVLLAAIGIYGLLAFAVSQRAHEIGVRVALGAGAGDILVMVLRRAALLAAAGIVPGAALAYAAGRSLAALLAGVDPADPVTFAAAVGLCLLMTVLGSLAPGRRALGVDPISVIRQD